MDYQEMAQEIEEHTGGLSTSPHLIPGRDSLDGYEQVREIVTGSGFYNLRL